MGLLYYTGKSNKNIKKAIYYFEIAAKNNIIEAYFYLGLIYLLGDDYPCDIKKALHYLNIAAKNGNSESQ